MHGTDTGSEILDNATPFGIGRESTDVIQALVDGRLAVTSTQLVHGQSPQAAGLGSPVVAQTAADAG
ncbi:hypothetical protein [Actinomyces qiguomingii]|uniref:hypothetical protein n=1 Tax=Actinomyces qiguomingii TaxID=2057800 RepID=UPI001304C74A